MYYKCNFSCTNTERKMDILSAPAKITFGKAFIYTITANEEWRRKACL